MIDMIQDNTISSPSQLCTFTSDSYLDRTSRPIYAIAYLLFFIVLYEIGTILVSPEALSEAISQSQVRVVAFVWIKNLLGHLGFTERMSWFATPLAVIVILLGLQITSRTRWFVRARDFIPMTVECIVLAIPLIVLSLALNSSINTAVPSESASLRPFVESCASSTNTSESPIPLSVQSEQTTGRRSSGLLIDIVTGIGAGIYEELVFRLILIILLMLLFQDIMHFKRNTSIVLSVVISAALFSAHHHIFFLNGRIDIGESFSMARFVFRSIAGVYFAILFAIRGFGIAAGSHAFYNIIAALLNTYLFTGQG